MALPLAPGLTPSETAFLAEMELVTVIPRQRLESFPLLSGPTLPLRPPQRADLPLWLALLLTRQRRADIVPPRWLAKEALQDILERETFETSATFTPAPSLPAPQTALDGTQIQSTPPFVPTSTIPSTTHNNNNNNHAAEDDEIALPYNYLPLSHLLLTHCAPTSLPDAEAIRRLLRDISEARGAKMRGAVARVDGGAGVRMSGVGAMEVAEGRAFLGLVVDGLRKVGVSREERAREEGGGPGGFGGGGGESDVDDDML